MAEAGTGISGRVTDSEGNPLASICFRVSLSFGLIGYVVSPTNTNGEYSVTVQTGGTYRVTTSSGNLNYIDQTTNVAVLTGQVTSNVNFSLSVGGIVNGIITGEGTGPLYDIPVEICNSSNAVIKQSETDTDGKYSVPGLPTGLYYVRTAVPDGTNYLDFWYGGVAVGGSGMPAGATGVTVTAGFATNNINIQLPVGGIISGTVTGEGYGSLSNISVNVYDSENTMIGQSTTATNGTYSVLGLPTGLYYVRTVVPDGTNYVDVWYGGAVASGYSVSTGATGVAVIAGMATNNINFQLPVGGIVSGHVRNEAGDPLENISIGVVNLAGQSVKSSHTDTNGSYIIAGLASGLHRVEVQLWRSIYLEQDVTVEVVKGAMQDDVDFVLSLGGAIDIRVTDKDSVPLSGVGLSCIRELSSGSFGILFHLPPPTTDSNGVYLISGLASGRYTVQAVGRNKGYGYINATQTNILVIGGVTNNITFALNFGAGISGRITDNSGRPLGGIYVSALNTNAWIRASPLLVNSNTNGEYVLRGLASGSYFVRTYAQYFGGTNNIVDEWYDDITVHDADWFTNAVAVEVIAGQSVSNVNFSLRAGGIIAGTVTDDHGLPRSGVTLSVCYTNADVAQSGATDSNGYYKITGLCSGAYYVKTGSGGDPALDQWYKNVPISGYGIPMNAILVSVVEGATTNNVDFILATGGSISGHVKTDKGDAVSYANIRVGEYLSVHGRSVLADENGIYKLSGLTSGVYCVTCDAERVGRVGQSSNVAVTAGQTVSNINFVLVRKAPQISACDRNDSRFKLSWTAAPYIGYQVECTTNLFSAWTNAPSGVLEVQKSLRSVSTSSELEYEIPESTDMIMFFRLRLKE